MSSEGSPRPESGEDSSSIVLDRLLGRASSASRYRLEGEIARGGMGAILRVWDGDLRRPLAMKVALGEPAAAGTSLSATQLVARFLEEAQVTGQLDHPGIVPVHELGLDSSGRLYFTMKLVEGRDLQAIFGLVFEGREGWNPTRALGVLLRVCEAVAYAHKKGVIHRDLKPANVMVGSFGEVFVMDWGLARVLGREDAHDLRLAPGTAGTGALPPVVRTERSEARLAAPDSPLVTMDGVVMGTPAYMSPEQARGEIEKLSPRSDVYSIGAMLYHLLARQVPYARPSLHPGERVDGLAVLRAVLAGGPKPLRELRDDVPAELEAICEKAMAREAADRYADTLELAEDLRAFLEGRVVQAYQTGAIVELRKWVSRNRLLAASLAAAVLSLLLGILISTAKTREAERATALARENERIAKSEKTNVLRLSAFQTLDDLTREADELWPADPRNAERYRAWLVRADALLAKAPEFRDSLAEIEKRALPQSASEREADRRGHPRAAEWERQQGELQWLSRMLGGEPWPSESDAAAELAQVTLPAAASDLNDLAWPWVDPEKAVYGSETKALLLARRAVALARTDAERAPLRDTLSWALYRTGRLDEALAEEGRARAEAGEEKRAEYEGYAAKVAAAVSRWQGAARAERADERDALKRQVAALEGEISARRDWRFADEDDRWWHAQMEKLLAALSAFGDEKTGLARGVSTEHGWGIGKRLAFASTLELRSVTGPEAARRWTEAIGAISESVKYRGVQWPSGRRLAPQLGLLPIGPDPASGLWEFSELATAEDFEPAARGADGKLILKEGMGIVFVLLPGGTFTMGAQSTDPARENYDPRANTDETPLNEVTLPPFFLSKFEMTQGQWLRFTGRNPSEFTAATYNSVWNRDQKAWSALHPVEQVSWTDCDHEMQRLDLLLPTEAQWEYAARGGTSTVYSSGDEPVTLREAGNVSDAFAKANGGGSWSVGFEEWDDGNVAAAEVGSYRSNPFGLHDVHGNEWEWCRDAYGSYRLATQPKDGERIVSDVKKRVFRGGCYDDAASSARSATRNANTPWARLSNLGLRPGRDVRP